MTVTLKGTAFEDLTMGYWLANGGDLNGKVIVKGAIGCVLINDPAADIVAILRFSTYTPETNIEISP